MVTPDAGLIEVVVDGRRYLGIAEEYAGEVAKSIQERVTRVAAAVGADPSSVPLLALSMQLAIAAKRDAGSDVGTSVDGLDDEHRLSTRDVAKQRGLSTGTVRRAVREGRLPAVPIGSGYAFRQADVDAFTPRKAAQ
jgi:excisionase family DNA binding protein